MPDVRPLTKTEARQAMALLKAMDLSLRRHGIERTRGPLPKRRPLGRTTPPPSIDK